MRRYARLFVTLAALAACREAPRDDDPRPAFVSRDAWYSPPPPGRSFEPLAAGRFASVVDALQSEAQGSLSAVPARALSAEEASRLAGRSLPADGQYVLLRSVVLFEHTGGFSVGVHERSVHVHHGSLGHGPAPMSRRAIVAVLPTLPDEVFLSCSMAD